MTDAEKKKIKCVIPLVSASLASWSASFLHNRHLVGGRSQEAEGTVLVFLSVYIPVLTYSAGVTPLWLRSHLQLYFYLSFLSAQRQAGEQM